MDQCGGGSVTNGATQSSERGVCGGGGWRGPAGWPGAPLGSGQGGRGEGVEDRQPSGVEEEQEGGEDQQHGEAVQVQAVEYQGIGVGPGRQAEDDIGGVEVPGLPDSPSSGAFRVFQLSSSNFQ